MNVTRIRMQHFMSHRDTAIDLPPQGLLAITGDNGEGKSSTIEAVAWGLWGKTLRGTVPWNGDAKLPCSAWVVAEGITAKRTRKGGKSELEWEGPVEQTEEFATTTKSQDVLEQELGTGFELWRKSHVFSSSDAAHFSLASDGERKRLIETFLGTAAFDGASKAARKDLTAAETKLAEIQRKRALAETKLASARVRLDESKKALAAGKEPAVVAAPQGTKLESLDRLIKETNVEIDQLTTTLRKLDGFGGELRAKAASAKALLARLRDDVCPTCTQAITETLRERVRADAALAAEDAEDARAASEHERDEATATMAELQEELVSLRAKRTARAAELQAAASSAAEAERYKHTRLLLERARNESETDVHALGDELEALAADEVSTSVDVAELQQCEKVLGLRGVRAHVLDESLAGIAAVTNGWLKRLRRNVTIDLAPYSENKSGGVKDSIALTINGAGDGKGYKANSGGERRRVDVSLLLGMGEVAAGAQGREPGTLFFDEVFDGLDDAGIEAVVDVLADLARERCVVVITHSAHMLARLRQRSARVLKISDGAASEV